MEFYYLDEYIKLLKKQKAEREIFLAHGFTEESLQKLFLLDRQQLRGDAKYYHRVASYITEDTADELKAMPDKYFSASVMDNIENESLHLALSLLSPDELDIVISHAVYDEPLKRIAARKGKSQSTVRNTYARARKKIKKFF